MIKKQQFKLPDGKGGEDIFYFETSADMVTGGNKSVEEILESLNQTVADNYSSLTAQITTTCTPKPKAVALDISRGSWFLDSEETSDYKYYSDILVDGLKSKDLAVVSFSRESYSVVLEAGVCPSAETLDGKIRLWAAEIPTAEIQAEYAVFEGAD